MLQRFRSSPRVHRRSDSQPKVEATSSGKKLSSMNQTLFDEEQKEEETGSSTILNPGKGAGTLDTYHRYRDTKPLDGELMPKIPFQPVTPVASNDNELVDIESVNRARIFFNAQIEGNSGKAKIKKIIEECMRKLAENSHDSIVEFEQNVTAFLEGAVKDKQLLTKHIIQATREKALKVQKEKFKGPKKDVSVKDVSVNNKIESYDAYGKKLQISLVTAMGKPDEVDKFTRKLISVFGKHTHSYKLKRLAEVNGCKTKRPAHEWEFNDWEKFAKALIKEANKYKDSKKIEEADFKRYTEAFFMHSLNYLENSTLPKDYFYPELGGYFHDSKQLIGYFRGCRPWVFSGTKSKWKNKALFFNILNASIANKTGDFAYVKHLEACSKDSKKKYEKEKYRGMLKFYEGIEMLQDENKTVDSYVRQKLQSERHDNNKSQVSWYERVEKKNVNKFTMNEIKSKKYFHLSPKSFKWSGRLTAMGLAAGFVEALPVASFSASTLAGATGIAAGATALTTATLGVGLGIGLLGAAAMYGRKHVSCGSFTSCCPAKVSAPDPDPSTQV